MLRVHQSNFRQLGFVEDVPIEALCELGVPVIDDVGSGALAALHDEPPVRRSVAAGAALVCFSGDKLLGGPQAGLLVGRAAAVEAARRHPLARALRIDKLSLAALEATLRLHRDAPEEIPVLAMLHATARGRSAPRAARWPTGSRAPRSIASSPASAAARCRCSSCPARSSRCPDASLAAALRPATRRCSAGSRTTACCSTPARWRTTRWRRPPSQLAT